MALRPCDIQGNGFVSPYLGQIVLVQGLVVADLDISVRRGFYIQEPDCDSDITTSDGIFVYLGERSEVVQIGDQVAVTGVVQEYYGFTEVAAYPTSIQIFAHGQPLPLPLELEPPFADEQSKAYFESLEGMYVRLSAGRVVGPTDLDRNTWLLDFDLGSRRVFADDPAGSGAVICAGDGGNYVITPEVFYGQQVTNLQGVMGYSFGDYCIDLTQPPWVEPAVSIGDIPLESTPVTEPGFLAIGTFNLHNLFDPFDDPLTQDTVLSSSEYQRRLEKRALAIVQLGMPAVLAVQEVESLAVLQDLANRPEIAGYYAALVQDGPDLRGLDVGILYRPDLVEVLSWTTAQGCTSLVDGLGPDGNLAVENPANEITCDSNGDGHLDGNRLFSRPPLLVHFHPRFENQADFWLIANHWKSKTEDTESFPYTRPRRTEQAQFVTGLGVFLNSGYPNETLIIAGDLNDWPHSEPVMLLETVGWQQAWTWLSQENRYSYIYHGRSQALDHIFINIPVLSGGAQNWVIKSINPLSINADYPASWASEAGVALRSSDHDPVRVDLFVPDERIYLPLILQ